MLANLEPIAQMQAVREVRYRSVYVTQLNHRRGLQSAFYRLGLIFETWRFLPRQSAF
jgi:hypothetical protein